METTVKQKEEKFESDLNEHTGKVVDELQKDQNQMHEWIGKLQPKLVQVPIASQAMSNTDAKVNLLTAD